MRGGHADICRLLVENHANLDLQDHVSIAFVLMYRDVRSESMKLVMNISYFTCRTFLLTEEEVTVTKCNEWRSC